MAKRQLKLGAFMRPVSIHTGAWRYPGAWPDANFNFPRIKQLIQKLEAGKFDAFFMADHLAVLNMPVNALKRSHTVTSFEPFTLLSALAGATEVRIKFFEIRDSGSPCSGMCYLSQKQWLIKLSCGFRKAA